MPDNPTNPDNDKTEPVPEIVMIPTGDLYVPDWNPRKYINEVEMQNLMSYRKNGGQVPPILVWKGPGHAPWAIISGQRRWIADTRLGKTHIASIILNITLEEAMILAYASNTDSKPHWLESVITIERLYKAQTKKSQDKLGAQLGGLTGARINLALKVAKALNPASRALIVNRVNDLGSESAGSEKAVRALADVLTPEEVEKALPVFLDRQMTETQAKNYARHVKVGNPPETYGKPNPTPQASHPSETAGSPPAELAPPQEPENDVEDEMITLKELYEHSQKTNSMGSFWGAMLGATAIFSGLVWLAWKAVVWVVTTVIHWL